MHTEAICSTPLREEPNKINNDEFKDLSETSSISPIDDKKCIENNSLHVEEKNLEEERSIANNLELDKIDICQDLDDKEPDVCNDKEVNENVEENNLKQQETIENIIQEIPQIENDKNENIMGSIIKINNKDENLAKGEINNLIVENNDEFSDKSTVNLNNEEIVLEDNSSDDDECILVKKPPIVLIRNLEVKKMNVCDDSDLEVISRRTLNKNRPVNAKIKMEDDEEIEIDKKSIKNMDNINRKKVSPKQKDTQNKSDSSDSSKVKQIESDVLHDSGSTKTIRKTKNNTTKKSLPKEGVRKSTRFKEAPSRVYGFLQNPINSKRLRNSTLNDEKEINLEFVPATVSKIKKTNLELKHKIENNNIELKHNNLKNRLSSSSDTESSNHNVSNRNKISNDEKTESVSTAAACPCVLKCLKKDFKTAALENQIPLFSSSITIKNLGKTSSLEVFGKYPRNFLSDNAIEGFSFGIIYKNDICISLMMELQPKCFKNLEESLKNMSCIIVQGTSEIGINNVSKILGIGDSFFIPQGCHYYIGNPSTDVELLINANIFENN